MVEHQQLFASDGADGDKFSLAVDLDASGNVALVGAFLRGVDDRGAAYVFVRSGDTWMQQAILTDASGQSGDYLGAAVALSADGMTALIGANEATIGGNANQGAAYIFINDNGTWTKQQQLIAGDGAVDDYFGQYLALSADGNTALVTAYSASPTVGDQGVAYVFVRNGTTWNLQQKLVLSNPVGADYFGSSAALSADGNMAVIGGIGRDTQLNNNHGAAYIFKRTGTTWSMETELTASDGNSLDYFGRSVAISADGTMVMVGASQDDETNVDQGSVYVYNYNGSAWVPQPKLAGSDSSTNAWFGHSIDLDAQADVAVIGSVGDTVNGGVSRGSASLFRLNAGTWEEQSKLSASDGATNDSFGYSVTINSDGNLVLIGANANDIGPNTNQGSAYIFKDVFTDCSSVVTIPTSECDALVAFYNSTNGANWTNNTNWLVDDDPCTWYGVVCNLGSVYSLTLINNNLVGTLPTLLGNLSQLEALVIWANRLSGTIPATIGNLSNLVQFDVGENQLEGDIPASFANLTNLAFNFTWLAYNKLTASDAGVIALLETVNPEWDETQTIPPSNVVASIDPAGLKISWTPILYQADSGYYTVTCNSAATGDITLNTSDKTSNEVILSGLPTGTYQCGVSTTTLAHVKNLSDLTSAATNASPLAYTGSDAPINDLFANPITLNELDEQNYSYNIANATFDGDKRPGINDNPCSIELTEAAAGIHYRVPGSTIGDGLVAINAGGPGWFRVRGLTDAADTAIAIYEENAASGSVEEVFGPLVACDDDNAPGEISISTAVFAVDPAKNYRVIIWNEGEAAEGAIIEIREATFDLLSPTDDSLYVAPTEPTVFTWESDPTAVKYTFDIAVSTQSPLSILSLVELTSDGEDDDGLACDITVCTLTVLPDSNLADYLQTGNFIWSVTAKDAGNVARESTQIWRLMIALAPPPTNLLTNSSMELDEDGDKIPDSWTPKNLLGDKRKCNTTEKLVAFEGECAFMFKGGVNELSLLEQTIAGSAFNPGDQLVIQLAMRGKLIPNVSKVKFDARIRYQDAGIPTQKVKLSSFPGVNNLTYTVLAPPAFVFSNQPVLDVRIRFQNRSLSGKLWIDSLEAIKEANATVNTGGGTSGLVPLPVAPDQPSLGQR